MLESVHDLADARVHRAIAPDEAEHKSSTPSARASSRCSPRWASRPSRPTAARRSSRPWGWTRASSTRHFTGTALAHRRRRIDELGEGGAGPPRPRYPRERRAQEETSPSCRWAVSTLAPRGRAPHVGPRDDRAAPAVARSTDERRPGRAGELRALADLVNEENVTSGDCCAGSEAARRSRADPGRGGRAGQGDRQALLDRRDELGALSPEAHETLAVAMNRSAAGRTRARAGRTPRRFTDDNVPLAIKQVASGRFGVTSTTWSTPKSCRSRSPRAPSRARAASCPATRSTATSPACATRHRAWA